VVGYPNCSAHSLPSPLSTLHIQYGRFQSLAFIMPCCLDSSDSFLMSIYDLLITIVSDFSLFVGVNDPAFLLSMRVCLPLFIYYSLNIFIMHLTLCFLNPNMPLSPWHLYPLHSHLQGPCPLDLLSTVYMPTSLFLTVVVMYTHQFLLLVPSCTFFDVFF